MSIDVARRKMPPNISESWDSDGELADNILAIDEEAGRLVLALMHLHQFLGFRASSSSFLSYAVASSISFTTSN